MVPMALRLGPGERGERTAGPAILGGLLAVEPATLFVLPALYSLMVRDRKDAVVRGMADTDVAAEAEPL